MKLLIVDDEELTRTGVISSIDWASLGISEVLQADDGVHGLETAQLHRPEIILCDVRMPRMDGIIHLSSCLTIQKKSRIFMNMPKDCSLPAGSPESRSTWISLLLSGFFRMSRPEIISLQ